MKVEFLFLILLLRQLFGKHEPFTLWGYQCKAWPNGNLSVWMVE